MNERLKEFAEQVYGSAHNDDFKFAELIVGECLDILEDEDNGSYEGRSVRIAAHRIKELFGV